MVLSLKKDIILAKIFCALAFGMSVIMLFSPEFPLRSAFPGTVHLMIVTGIVLRVQKEYDITLLQKSAARFLTYVGIAYFIVSAGFTLQHLYDHQDYNKKLMETPVKDVLVQFFAEHTQKSRLRAREKGLADTAALIKEMVVGYGLLIFIPKTVHNLVSL